MASPLSAVEIVVGMEREQLEQRIAQATNQVSDYNGYNSFSETEARYVDGDTTLIVEFEPGTPAPWVEGPDGVLEHQAHGDSRVKSWRFEAR